MACVTGRVCVYDGKRLGRREAFPGGCYGGVAEAAAEGNCWRCPWNFQEVKGLLMQPAAKQVVLLSEHHVGGAVRRPWAALIGDFARNVQATRRTRLSKTLEAHAAVLKRELRRPTDIEADRQERERGAEDARALLGELAHPAVAGLQAEEVWLAEEPALRRIAQLVREQVSEAHCIRSHMAFLTYIREAYHDIMGV